MFDKKQFAHVFDIKDFDRLELNLLGTDLVIHQADQPSIIYYGEQKDSERFKLSQEGHTLRITEKTGLGRLKKTLSFRFSVGKSRLEVSLPQTNFKKLTADVVRGDIAIDNVKTSVINLIAGTGTITVANSMIDNFEVRAQSGNLLVKKSEIKSGNLNDQTGDILFDEFESDNLIEATFAEGRLKMRNVVFKDGQITLGQGDVHARDFKVTGDFNLSTNIGDLSLNKIEAPTITIAAIRGNDLKNPDAVSGLPKHEKGKAGASFITSAGHLDVGKEIKISE